MYVRVPVTRYYEVKVCLTEDCTGVCRWPESDRRVRQCLRKLTAEQVESQGKLVDRRVGRASVTLADYPLEAPCTD